MPCESRPCIGLAPGQTVPRAAVRLGCCRCSCRTPRIPRVTTGAGHVLELVLELLQVWRLCVLRLCLRPNCAKSERHQGQACDSYPLVQTERFHSVSATYRARYQMPRQTKTVTFVSENSAACSVSIRM